MDTLVWIAFVAGILALLGVDLFLHRGKTSGLRDSLLWSVVWIGLGFGFAAVLWAWRGPDDAAAYTAGYVIEKSLSVDNCFVFAVIFSALAVPEAFQRRVLFWGVLGALALRGVFIAGGAALLDAFHYALYGFAAILLVTAWKLARHRHVTIDPRRNLLLRALARVIPVTDRYHGDRFLVRHGGVLTATPLLAALVAVEATDVVFALDSVPAIFSITDDTFLVFTSNAFAILGLRSLTFLLSGSIARFHYLSTGLAAILGLAGLKMALADVAKVPIGVSLGAIAAILAVAVLASLQRERRHGRPAAALPGRSAA